jgi:hypothetical protein
VKLSFGKYKARDLTDEAVPSDYLEYLLGWPKLWPETRQAVEAELGRRKAESDLCAINRTEDVSSCEPYEEIKPNTDDPRLLAAGWLRSNLGHWSKWICKSKRRPGWCCYQVSRPLAVLVQDHLDSARAKAQRKKTQGKKASKKVQSKKGRAA